MPEKHEMTRNFGPAWQPKPFQSETPFKWVSQPLPLGVWLQLLLDRAR